MRNCHKTVELIYVQPSFLDLYDDDVGGDGNEEGEDVDHDDEGDDDSND